MGCTVDMMNFQKPLCTIKASPAGVGQAGFVWSQPPDHFAADLQWVTKPLAVLLSYFISCPKFLCPSFFFLNHFYYPLHWLCQAAAVRTAGSQNLVSLASNSKKFLEFTLCAQENSSERVWTGLKQRGREAGDSHCNLLDWTKSAQKIWSTKAGGTIWFCF